MGAANLSHSANAFATIAGRMRRLQNAKAGLRARPSQLIDEI